MQYLIKDTVGGKEIKEYTESYNPGDKMRECIDSLVDAFNPSTADLIEQDCNHNRDRKLKNEPAKADHECVSNSLPKTSCPKQVLEVLKSHPVAVPNAFHKSIVLKSKLDPIDRQVTEDQIEDDSRNNHQPICPVFQEGSSHPDQKTVIISLFIGNHTT